MAMKLATLRRPKSWDNVAARLIGFVQFEQKAAGIHTKVSCATVMRRALGLGLKQLSQTQQLRETEGMFIPEAGSRSTELLQLLDAVDEPSTDA